ncbi:hypothetical protein ACET3Z_016686 [Daucus carota]
MAPGLDCAVSSLLCSEETESIYFDECVEDLETSFHNKTIKNQIFEAKEESFYSLLPLQSDEAFDLMLKKECEHLPASDYGERLRNGVLDLKARQEAVDWIGKVNSYFNFGPQCAYISVNYFDRFISAYELPAGKAWMMQLLAVACVSLAAKTEETEVPLLLDLQVCESKFIFEARTIQRMELLVLSTLKWRMQSVTPFSFIEYFIAKTTGDHIASTSTIYRSTQLIASLTKGIEFLEFRPSEIAAAVALSVAGDTHTVETKNALYKLDHHLQKDKLVKCVELIKRSSPSFSAFRSSGPNGLIPSSLPRSPSGVLDAAACLSYRSDDSTVESCLSSSHYAENTKRRKLS